MTGAEREMRCVDDEAWTTAINVGGGVRMLATGRDTGRRFLVEHACKVVNGYRLVVAPALDNTHQVVSKEPLTITPSLACTDCGLHGFVTDGRWVPC